jgi:Na+/melibiose symporter-like transporter
MLSKANRLSVSQRVTAKVRDGAFYGRFVGFCQSAIIAFVHAGKVSVWGVVAQVRFCFRKAKDAGSIPAAGSMLDSSSTAENRTQRGGRHRPFFLGALGCEFRLRSSGIPRRWR